MIYNREFNNSIQKKVIDSVLDKLLINNDILLRTTIYEFLSDKCEHCNLEIVNPRLIDGNIHVCEKCINWYVYCAEDECRNIICNIKIKYHDRCKNCLSWFCDEHRQNSKCCRSNYLKFRSFVHKHFIIHFDNI